MVSILLQSWPIFQHSTNDDGATIIFVDLQKVFQVKVFFDCDGGQVAKPIEMSAKQIILSV